MPILTVSGKLEGNETDRAEMAATVEAFARACRSVARETPDFETSQYEPQAQSRTRPTSPAFASRSGSRTLRAKVAHAAALLGRAGARTSPVRPAATRPTPIGTRPTICVCWEVRNAS
jgi:hypothetical protein